MRVLLYTTRNFSAKPHNSYMFIRIGTLGEKKKGLLDCMCTQHSQAIKIMIDLALCFHNPNPNPTSIHGCGFLSWSQTYLAAVGLPRCHWTEALPGHIPCPCPCLAAFVLWIHVNGGQPWPQLLAFSPLAAATTCSSISGG